VRKVKDFRRKSSAAEKNAQALPSEKIALYGGQSGTPVNIMKKGAEV
jgi:hypothetical protein